MREAMPANKYVYHFCAVAGKINIDGIAQLKNPITNMDGYSELKVVVSDMYKLQKSELTISSLSLLGQHLVFE